MNVKTESKPEVTEGAEVTEIPIPSAQVPQEPPDSQRLSPRLRASASSVVPLSDNQITEKIIGAAIEVHRHLGPGLLESAYEECLCYELNQFGLRFQRQVYLPIFYKGIRLASVYRMDLVIEDAVVVEIKASDDVASVHAAQLLTYLKSANMKVGLLINFNVPILKNGLKRVCQPLQWAADSVKQEATMRPWFDAETRRRGEEIRRAASSVATCAGGTRTSSLFDSVFSFSALLSPRLRVSASNWRLR